MSKPFKDTTVSVVAEMTLEIKEVRGSSTLHSPKEGFAEVSRDTSTRFHWRLCGIASKMGPEEVASAGFNIRGQEIYNVAISSDAFDFRFPGGFKSREDAIRNAVQFAERNGIEVDGYEPASERKELRKKGL